MGKHYLKLLCSSIYTKEDGTDEYKENVYKSFHILARYLQKRNN